MLDSRRFLSRRSVIVVAFTALSAFPPIASSQGAPAQTASVAKGTGDLHDWDWLVGKWTVRHHRLKDRLVGSTQWEDFNGTCVNWPTLGGQGNVDDNVMELPAGTYRGVGIRALDASDGQWSIWWIDARTSRMDPPVRGGFKDGVGTFIGDDTLNGRPIKMRFRWTSITPTSAHWEQAFSADGGVTWETNWTMEFTRTR